MHRRHGDQGPTTLNDSPTTRHQLPNDSATTLQRLRVGSNQRQLRSDAYRVFTRKRVFLVKSSVTILRTGLHVAVNGDFAHNNLRRGTAFRLDCYLYTIRSASQR